MKIKKQICMEEGKNRTEGLLPFIPNNDSSINAINGNNSNWGEFCLDIVIDSEALDFLSADEISIIHESYIDNDGRKILRYKDLSNRYFSVRRIIENSNFAKGVVKNRENVWISIENDIRRIVDTTLIVSVDNVIEVDEPFIKFRDNSEWGNETISLIVDDLDYFLKLGGVATLKIFWYYNGIIPVPESIKGQHVPFFINIKDIARYKHWMTVNSTVDVEEIREKWEDLGGEEMLSFLNKNSSLFFERTEKINSLAFIDDELNKDNFMIPFFETSLYLDQDIKESGILNYDPTIERELVKKDNEVILGETYFESQISLVREQKVEYNLDGTNLPGIFKKKKFGEYKKIKDISSIKNQLLKYEEDNSFHLAVLTDTFDVYSPIYKDNRFSDYILYNNQYYSWKGQGCYVVKIPNGDGTAVWEEKHKSEENVGTNYTRIPFYSALKDVSDDPSLSDGFYLVEYENGIEYIPEENIENNVLINGKNRDYYCNIYKDGTTPLFDVTKVPEQEIGQSGYKCQKVGVIEYKNATIPSKEGEDPNFVFDENAVYFFEKDIYPEIKSHFLLFNRGTYARCTKIANTSDYKWELMYYPKEKYKELDSNDIIVVERESKTPEGVISEKAYYFSKENDEQLAYFNGTFYKSKIYAMDFPFTTWKVFEPKSMKGVYNDNTFMGRFIHSIIEKDGNINIKYFIDGLYKPDIDINGNNKPEEAISYIDGTGIEYDEKYPIIYNNEMIYSYKEEIGSSDINPRELTCKIFYNKIDFENKASTVNSDKFKLDRNALIANVKYQIMNDAYFNGETDYPVFKDEIFSGINEVGNLDAKITVNRGNAAAFEDHMKLMECNTLEDLQDYGNNYFKI